MPRGATVADLWCAYVDDLGDKQTAATMGTTGNAILPHFGAYQPQDMTKALFVAQGHYLPAHMQDAVNVLGFTSLRERQA